MTDEEKVIEILENTGPSTLSELSSDLGWSQERTKRATNNSSIAEGPFSTFVLRDNESVF